MLPQFSCNLLEALPLPPWRCSLDWDLHITRKWERRTPFSFYVKRSTDATNSLQKKTSTFSAFTSLPAELQLRILGFCSPCTLFQLMRVSSALRAEASKLFWENPAAYFLIDASWLLDGAYPGYRCYDFAFLRNVHNVEIEYEPSTNSDICQRTTGEPRVRQDRIALFWDAIRRRFPHAKSVVINQNGESGIWRSGGVVPQPLQLLLQACPSTLQASALVLEKQTSCVEVCASTDPQSVHTWKRSCYHITADGVEEKVEAMRYDTILLPAKLRSGLVGDFERLRRRCFLVELQQYSLWPLAIEALDRYYFESSRAKSFSCPLTGCNAYFEAAGTWTVHAAKAHYQHLSQFSILPEEIRALFEERARLLKLSNKQAKIQFETIKREWNSACENDRSNIERVWKAQLRDDTVQNAEDEAGEDKLWEDFLQWASPAWDCY